MALSSMVVSRDLVEISVLECILGGLHMQVAVETDPRKALAQFSRTKIDALIVDCDLNGSFQLLRDLQALPKEPTVPLVIMGGPQCLGTFDETGALFAFEKPISVEQAVRTLSAAHTMILDRRLRYHRTGLAVPVSLKSKGKRQEAAQLINVSQGGMLLRSDSPIDTRSTLQVSFELPGAKSGLKANAEVVWQDGEGNLGVRFVRVAPPQQ